MEAIIKIKNLDFTYNKGKDNEFQSLINITLDIFPEEFVVVFGPSGCGKSTLLNVIAGLEMPDSGSIFVLNKDLIKMSKNEFALYHRTQVGMIYQAYNLITSLTVLDNVTLPQIFINVRRGKRNKWGRELLERFGILKQARKIPTELSGGQQQRIGIARAIVNNPQIILADEPVGNLDSVSAKNVFEILKELNEKEKRTIVLVTHNPEFLDYADRILNMKDGIITREIVNRDRHKRKEGGEPLSKPPTAEINDLMRAYHGLSPEQINILIMPYKAKIFSHHFISCRNLEETKTLEDVIQRRLLGTISLEEFFDILNRSTGEGGVGFDIRTAEKIIRRINRVIRMAYFIYQKGRQRKNIYGEHKKITDDEKAQRLTTYLLNTCYGEYYSNLDKEQTNRLQRAVKDRLSGKMQKSEFYNFLDLPFKDGGVGLNSKTARAVTEEIELVLILGFGIVQKVKGSEIGQTVKKFAKDIMASQPSQEVLSKEVELVSPVAVPTTRVEKGAEGKLSEEKQGDESLIKKEKTKEKEKDEHLSESLPKVEKASSLSEAMEIAQRREEELKSGLKAGDAKTENANSKGE
jgi:putative ABC transport system ATP-binding protein